jgi:sugar/nucleoside kinase (ribokinase family)
MKDQNQAPFRVVSLGDLVMDVILEGVNLPVVVNLHQEPGKVLVEPGGAGNFLITAARLGMSPSAIGVIGEDAFGAQLIDILKKEKVQTEGIIIHADESTSTVFVLKDFQDQYVFLGHLAPGQSVKWNPNWEGILKECEAIQLLGYSLIEERMVNSVLQGLEYAKHLGKPIFFDPGPLAAQIDTLLLKQVIRQCAVITLNQQEVNLLTGSSAPESMKSFLAEGVDMVCIKRASQGCSLFRINEEADHPGFAVDVIDTAGAGDAFNAGLVLGWLNGWELSEIAAFANAVGAAKAKKNGTGRNMPTRQEIVDMLSDHNVPLPVFLHD